MFHLRYLIVLLLTLCCGVLAPAGASAQPLTAGPGLSAEVTTDAIHSQLVSSHATITPGQSFTVAWRMRLDPHWHVYWHNPGDSGLPPELSFPQGYTATSPSFPTPRVISVPPVTNYGYEDEVILTTQVTAPTGLPTGALELPVALSYLYCSDVCLPGEASATLPLTVGVRPVANPAFNAVNTRQQATQPRALPAGAAPKATVSGQKVSLTLNVAALGNPASLRFIPAEESWLHDSGEQMLHGQTLSLPADPYQDAAPTRLNGLLLVPGGLGYTIDIPVTGGPAAAAGANGTSLPPGLTAPAPDMPEVAAQSVPLALFFAVIFAFIAGLILNVMPCVLPVLSLKLLSLVRSHDAAARRRHTLAYTFGIILSFWAFALVIGLLQAGGQQLGWGFHLQNPLFVAALAALMLAVALNFFGVFEMGQSFTRLTARPGGKQTPLGDFSTGLLAVIVAPPCTVPFMGGAMAYALNASVFTSLLVFTFMGLGMASPFLLAMAYPRLLRWLPRPGAWMTSFKALLGWPMLATGLWLLWVFGNQTGTVATFVVLMLLLALAFSLWVYGRKPSWRATALICVPLVTGAWLLPPLAQLNASPEHGGVWQAWSTEAVTTARAAGKPVFVDFTADWCLTCKVTEATVLNTSRVQTMFADNKVVLLKGDWTRRDPAITAELARHGRKGVPLYLAYPVGRTEPIILPQLLTPGLLEDTFK